MANTDGATPRTRKRASSATKRSATRRPAAKSRASARPADQPADEPADRSRAQTDGDEASTPNELLPEKAKNDSFDDSHAMLNYDRIPAGLAEGLRGIINRYELRAGAGLPKSVAVTSALEGEGVTTVSQSLATLIAHEMGRFVCWVDCSWLALDSDPASLEGRQSLIDVLANPSSILSAFQTSPELPQLVAWSAGAVPNARRNMIVRSPEFERLLKILADEFDHVIFDIPPVLPNANGLALLRQADASLVVVQHRATTISQVRRTIAATQPTPNLGIVLNRYRSSIPARIQRLLGQ